jgi:hypothetical protein
MKCDDRCLLGQTDQEANQSASVLHIYLLVFHVLIFMTASKELRPDNML